jgi:hypothetical protein
MTKFKLIVNTSNFDVNDTSYMNKMLSQYDANEVTLVYLNNRKQQNEDNKIKSKESNFRKNL